MPFESSFRRAFSWPVVRLALLMAVVVGTILVMINHGTCLIDGKFGIKCFWQSALTFLVPYSVSTISSVIALSNQNKN